MCRHRGWNYLLKARKPVKDGGRNKMYGSCQALQRHSHMTDQVISIRDCVLRVASDGLGSFVSLSFTGPERGDRTGFLTAPAPREPASSSYQPARRNTHTALPASPSSSQHIPQAFNPIPNTLSLHLLSTLKTHTKGRKHRFLKQGMHVQFSACLWPSQLSRRVTLHSAHNQHTCAPSQLLVCEKTI